MLFACAQGADAGPLAAPDLLVLPLICAGQLPPAFVDYALRDGAAGVVVASCRDGGCAFRLGARWTAERLTGLREPHLRADAAGAPLRHVEADAGETAELAAAVRLDAPEPEPVQGAPRPSAEDVAWLKLRRLRRRPPARGVPPPGPGRCCCTPCSRS